MPNDIAGSMLVSVLNPDGTLVGSGAAATDVTVTNFPATQTVAGTVTANAGTGVFNTTTGSITSTTTLNAVTGNATGAVTDFGSAKAIMSVIAQSTGTLAGDLSFKVSHNNTLFVEVAAVPIAAAESIVQPAQVGARYARVDLVNATGTGTITATLMGV